MFKSIKSLILQKLEIGSIRKHRSRIGWQDAGRYSKYLSRCQKEQPAAAAPAVEIQQAVVDFNKEGLASFVTEKTTQIAQEIFNKINSDQELQQRWDSTTNEYGSRNYQGDIWNDFPEIQQLFGGDLGDFLQAYFKSPFKIFYGALYKSEHSNEVPTGSQLWHSDAGPGICINVMFYLHDTTPDNGPLQVIPWDTSLQIYEEEKELIRREILAGNKSLNNRIERRQFISDFYNKRTATVPQSELRQPYGAAGLVVPFLNNTLHRGGFPDSGKDRTAIVFHCYPSHQELDLERYKTHGIKKHHPYPVDPSESF